MPLQMIEDLLLKVSDIINSYDKIAQARGSGFNIFKILKLESKEVRLHSTFIAELLDPKGSHGQNEEFLKLFINHFKIKNFELESVKVQVEKYIGLKTVSTGGRIDILLENRKKQRIIIENKIYAYDQENQIVRYYNFDKQANLFYLSLDGLTPDIRSCGALIDNEHYYSISYKYNIVKWLEECLSVLNMHSILKETINQYIHLIKHLTGQISNNEMKKEINKVIRENPNYIQAAYTISASLPDLQNEVFEKFIEQLERLAEKLNLKIKKDENFGEKHVEMIFSREDWKDYYLGLSFEKPNRIDLLCGISTKNKSYFSSIKEITEFDTWEKGDDINEYVIYKYIENYNNINSYEGISAILNGELVAEIENYFIELQEVMKKYPEV